MNDVSIHVPYIFGSKQNSLIREERKQIQKEGRGTWYQERPMVGPNRPEREAKLTHSNLQISKRLCIIIRSCNKYKLLARINTSVHYI